MRRNRPRRPARDAPSTRQRRRRSPGLPQPLRPAPPATRTARGRRRTLGHLADRLHEPPRVVGVVVVHEPGAHRALGIEAEEALELPGVVVALPDGDLALGQRRRDLGRRVPGDVEHQRRHAVGRVAVERHALDPGEALGGARHQLLLVCADRVEADLEHVLGRRRDAGERLERERAELEAVGRLVGRGLELVGHELGHQPGRAAEDADVRAVPLVGGAGERVGAERGEVERPVRGGGDRVERDARAGGVRGGDDRVELRHRADRVRRGGDRDPARALREHGLDGRGGQRERVAIGLRPAHRRAGALGRDHPGTHVRVVVQARHDDLVARRQRPPDGGREPHRHRGHRRAEGDVVAGPRRTAGRRRRAPARRTRRSRARRRTRRRGWRRARSASSRPSPRSRCRPSASRRARPGAPSSRRRRGSGRGSCARAGDAHQLGVVRIAQQRGRGRHVHPAHLVHLVVRLESRVAVLRLHQPVADGLLAPLVVAVGHRRQLLAEPAAQPDLLLDLAQRGLLPRLARVELALRQRPVVVARPVHDDELELPARRAAPDDAA